MEPCDAPSSARYKTKGCRCDGCRAAQREAMRAYYARVGGNRWRKPEHYQRQLAYKREKPYTNQQRERDQRRRARKHGVQSMPVDHARVFDRDGWTCWLCNEPVDSALSRNSPLGATIDHVVPLSRGGWHAEGNVRLAHRVCNVRRGNRVVLPGE